ncbi:multidrug resistance-associated ABC transporter [Mycena sp. CBHHK59/15]|nr:multidrug resistance-associated ABC transporter [Mycena sp. CBHHK59/15]
MPLYVAALSALALLVCFFARFRAVPPEDEADQKSWTDMSRYGGLIVLVHNVARLLACLTLLGLSIASLIVFETQTVLGLKLGWCSFYIYASLLAAAALGLNTKWGPTAALHLNYILAVAAGVYFYRDIFPFATYTWPVQDAAEGPIFHAKLIALGLAGVIIPLVIPRTYIPVDPKSPMPVPNAEQTASLLSLALFPFLDPVILLAYKLPHLPYDLLPPLADTDYAANLKARGFKNLDVFSGASKDHIFFGIMKTFRREYFSVVVLLTVYVACIFASPIGINRVLDYFEKGDTGSNIRPFVWILWLAFGPLCGTITFHSYYRISMRILVQVEGLLTELIFEHALRVRVKAHQPDAVVPAESAHGSAEPSEDAASSDTGSETAQGSQSTASKHPKHPTVAASSASSSIDVGKISNLVTTDLRNVTAMSDFLMLLFYMPLNVIFCVIFLYIILGWSSFVGMGTMLVLFPLSGLASKFLQHIQVNRIRAADARIGTISETITVLRMIKMFGWESKMLGRVNDNREEELLWIWKREIFEFFANTVNDVIPIFTMLATYITYVGTVIMKEELRPSMVFSTMPVFEMLRMQLHMANFRIIQFVDAKVSLDRINDFLHNTELLDTFTENEETSEFLPPQASTEIGFRDASFTWSKESDGATTPSRHKFVLRIEDELLFKRGCVNLVLGPTGSGKTSLLMALLSEMHFAPSSPSSWYNLPRDGWVAYAAQESWVLNETIRDNILFGAEYDEERYRKVIYQCALERDLELFEAGDKSEVGEKGLTLSGGQKARCTLARAIYSKAEVLLLDDVLAALDVHTSKWIVEKCLNGDLVQGRTIILVTHNVALTAPIAGFTISIGLNGRILSQGSVADALKHDVVLAKAADADLQTMEQVVDAVEPVEVKAEPKTVARYNWGKSNVGLYLRGLGGPSFYIIFLGCIFLSQVISTYETWYLGYFASQYETRPPGEVKVSYYLGIYSLITLSEIMVHSVADVIFAYAVLRASRSIHRQLIESILGTTLRWLDVTPASRVIARFTGDITAVDGPILNVFANFTHVTISMMTSFGAVVLLTPLFFVPGFFAAIIGGFLGQAFLKAQLSVKRESSNAKAPYSAISGLTSIRAYGAQTPFIEESLRRINKYSRAARTLSNLDRWVGVRLAVVGNLLAAILAAYLVYFQRERANNVGFSLNMAAAFSMRILFWVRVWNDVQIQGELCNSLERIQQYIHIEQETKLTEAGKPSAHWPSSGELIVDKPSARYSPDGPQVLRDISFRVKSGERVGIVGRTGSGKSSLTLALLRCIYTEGTVHYDGIPTSAVNLDVLRSNITIIPQMPELLSGTLRHNLDPFSQYDDATLNSSLRAAGLFSLQNEMEEGRLTLDSVISSGGSNLSVGQRQILALARAIVRDSKLLILDEATSAIDYKTDTVIQSSLRNELKPDVTVITVAHRLQTILDSDKIMVLDEGRMVEFDSPKVLLQNPKGKLRALVNESGDKEKLYAMAEGKNQ